MQEFRLELVDDSAARTRNLSGLLTAEEALIDIRRVLSVKDLAMWKQWDMDGYEPDVSVIGLSTRQSINLQKFSLIKDNVSKMNLYEIEDERGFELCLTEVESILAMTDEMSINELLTEEVL